MRRVGESSRGDCLSRERLERPFDSPLWLVLPPLKPTSFEGGPDCTTRCERTAQSGPFLFFGLCDRGVARHRRPGSGRSSTLNTPDSRRLVPKRRCAAQPRRRSRRSRTGIRSESVHRHAIPARARHQSMTRANSAAPAGERVEEKRPRPGTAGHPLVGAHTSQPLPSAGLRCSTEHSLSRTTLISRFSS